MKIEKILLLACGALSIACDIYTITLSVKYIPIPDDTEITRLGLYADIALQYYRVIVSFIVFCFSFCVDFSGFRDEAKKGIQYGVFFVECFSILTVIGMAIFHCWNWSNTTYGDYPWNCKHYYFEVIFIAIARSGIILATALYFGVNIESKTNEIRSFRPGLYLYSRLPIHFGYIN